MIPKVIHFCWLSNDPFPLSIQKCIDSWKKTCLIMRLNDGVQKTLT